MGVSRELLSGTTNWTSSTVGLRMLDNTLRSYVDQVHSLLEWIFSRTSKYLGVEDCKVTLTPFKLTDDETLRAMLMQSVQTGQASMSTLYESFGMDYNEELRKMKEDKVSAAVNEIETQIEIERGTFLATRTLSEKIGQDDAYKTALGQAQQMAEELFQTDESTKRQTLNALKMQDMALYLMVAKLLEEYNESNRAAMQDEQIAAQAQAAPGAGGDVSGAPPSAGGGETVPQEAPTP